MSTHGAGEARTPPIWLKDLQALAGELEHSGPCWEHEGENSRFPDECTKCYLEQVIGDIPADLQAAHESGIREGMQRAAQMAEDANIPQGFRGTSLYTEFERGGDEYLTQLAAAIRQASESAEK